MASQASLSNCTEVAKGRAAASPAPAAAASHELDHSFRNLVARNRRLETALDNMSQGLCMFDAQSHLVVCNRRYYEIFDLEPGTLMFGMTQIEICGLLIEKGSYPSDVTLESIRRSTLKALKRDERLPVLRELADGRIISVLYRALPEGGWVSTFEDITAQRQSEARIEHLARHDALTDLAHSRTLRDESQGLLRTFAAEAKVLAMLYLDLDRFKFINDTYGHDVGDELLRSLAGRLRASTRRDDRVGRLGGDEFAIMLRVSDVEEALVSAERLVSALSLPYDLSVARVEVGVTIGVSTREGVVDDVESLLQEADLALRHAKATERGTVCLFDPAMSESARMRRTLESDLHAALAAEQFEVHYQPLVSIDDKRVIGLEALVRWRHPERGLVPPDTFIRLAEEIGLIVPLGEWVLYQSCRDAQGWRKDLTIAVNVSCVQMRQKTFADVVFRVLAETNMQAARLELELTESVLLDESDVIMQNLHKLRAAGVRFVMDDFGTGYSSLSYLRRFAFDKIKIDRSFMKDAASSGDALAIIRAVASLGASLSIMTLAEGVETNEQYDLAKSEGIGQVQGFLFSRPQPKHLISNVIGGSHPVV